MKKNALAFDIGGSKGIVGLVREDGEVMCSERFTWSSLTKEGVLSQIEEAADRILKANASCCPDVIGVTIPGLADAEKGIWVEASFSGIQDWPIAKLLENRFQKPCFADNDANAAALAEHCYGSAIGLSDFLYLTVSNGIGGAAFSDGKLVRGSTNNVMEIGHCPVVENGRMCGCGNHGCLEMHASGRAMELNYIELGGQLMPDGSSLDCKQIAERAMQGEESALRTFELEGEYLGKAIATACNLFNPQQVIIGGGVSLSFSLFEKSLLNHLQQHLYLRANRGLRIRPTGIGYNGALLGAATVGFHGLNQ